MAPTHHPLEKPLVTLIMSVYNTEAYLPQCIDSVLDQTYDHWELLIGDDGSTDRSASICDDYARKDARIKVWHGANRGKPSTCNDLIKKAKGNYIAFLDSDDWLDSLFLETLFSALRSQDAQYATCGWYMSYQNQSVPMSVSDTTVGRSRSEAIVAYYDRQLYSTLWGKLFARDLLLEPIPQLVRFEDQAVLYKWLSHTEQTVFCQQILYHYRQRASSLMNAGKDQTGQIPITEECFHYLKEHAILSDDENKRIAATQLIREAKYAARRGWKSIEAVRNIQRILLSIQCENCESLDAKTKRRLHLLLKSPHRFVFLQMVEALFVRGHHEAQYQLFP